MLTNLTIKAKILILSLIVIIVVTVSITIDSIISIKNLSGKNIENYKTVGQNLANSFISKGAKELLEKAEKIAFK